MSTETQKLRGAPVSHVAAERAAQRFINEHFDNAGEERPQTRVPADYRDDDIVLMDYIQEQKENTIRTALTVLDLMAEHITSIRKEVEREVERAKG